MASTSVVVYTCPVNKAVFSQQASLGGLAIKPCSQFYKQKEQKQHKWQMHRTVL